jgi:predicted patatin/cPLA2 family phospholipase
VTAGPHGVRPLEAVAAIRDRAASRNRGDGRKLALVFEGGGMRGAYSGGGAVALEQMGFTDVFDEVYATSAGAMNAAYFLAGQAAQGIALYPDHLAQRKFYNPCRFWKIFDIDFVFDRLVTIDVPLDLEAVSASPSRFFVAAMDRRTGEGRLINAQGDVAVLRASLKAATAIPVLYNRSVRLENRDYVDGGLVMPFPLTQALARGCTDVLVLLSSDEADDRDAPPLWARLVFRALCARGSARLNAAFADYAATRARCLDIALGREAPAPPVRIVTVTSKGLAQLHRTTMNPEKLRRAANEYRRRVLDLFGHVHPEQ